MSSPREAIMSSESKPAMGEVERLVEKLELAVRSHAAASDDDRLAAAVSMRAARRALIADHARAIATAQRKVKAANQRADMAEETVRKLVSGVAAIQPARAVWAASTADHARIRDEARREGIEAALRACREEAAANKREADEYHKGMNRAAADRYLSAVDGCRDVEQRLVALLAEAPAPERGEPTNAIIPGERVQVPWGRFNNERLYRPTPAAPVTPAGSGGERERIAGLVIAHERLCVECGIALGSVPEDMAKTSRAALRSRGAILTAVQALVDERDRHARTLAACDAEIGRLHAENNRQFGELAAAQAENERQTRLVGQLRVDLSAFAVPEIECNGCGAPIGPDEPHHSGDVTGCWPYVSDVKTDHMPCYRYRTQQGVERSWPPCALLAPDASPQAESGREVDHG